VTVAGSGSISTDGQTKVTVQGSTGTSNTQGVGQVHILQTGKQQGVSVGVGAHKRQEIQRFRQCLE